MNKNIKRFMFIIILLGSIIGTTLAYSRYVADNIETGINLEDNPQLKK